MILSKCYGYDDVLIRPNYSTILSRKEVSLVTSFTKNIIVPLPFVSAPMDTVTGHRMVNAVGDLGCLGVLHRFCTIEEQCEELKLSGPSVVSIGVDGDWYDRALALYYIGVKAFVIEVAHADNKKVHKAISKFKNDPTLSHIDLMVGNVATADGARRLAELGVDGIKVGIGPGSMCSTRIETGIGVPQLTAVYDAAMVADKYNIPICADGGIRFAGDIVKALAAGASTIMAGGLFAGTTEAPGEVKVVGFGNSSRKVKEFRGSASYNSKINDGRPDEHIEGLAQFIPYKGSVELVIKNLTDGVKSGLSYVGAKNIEELQAKAQFIEVTSNVSHLPKMQM